MAGGEDLILTGLLAAGLSTPRTLVALSLLPFLSTQLLGGSARVALAVAWASLVFPLTFRDLTTTQVSLTHLLVLVPKELLVGALVGFLAAVPFWVAAGFGRLLDYERGAMSVVMFIPTFQGPASPLGTLCVQALATVFLSGMGVTAFLELLYQSYIIWPVWDSAPAWETVAPTLLGGQFHDVLYWIVLLAAPSIILVLLIDVVMGVLNRFVPEINVFFLTLPFRATAVVFVFTVYSAILVHALERHWFVDSNWLTLLKGLLR